MKEKKIHIEIILEKKEEGCKELKKEKRENNGTLEVKKKI